MQGLLPGGEKSPLPNAVTTQRKVSRAVFDVVSTGATLQRESMTVARTATHLPLNAVERTTNADASGAHATVDEQFDTAQDASDRAEDRFLTVLLSTGQLTAEYAELVDDSAERLCPLADERAK